MKTSPYTDTQIPTTDWRTGQETLRVLLGQRSILATLEHMHADLGNVFQIPLRGFEPVVLVGPEANHQVLVADRDRFRWRNQGDPVTRLLRHGLLVEDGKSHDQLREYMAPFFHRRRVLTHVDAMVDCVDRVSRDWNDGTPQDMLVEMRRLALLILMETLFGVEFDADLERMWPAILRVIDYISPGLWILGRCLPRLGYRQALGQMDAYLYHIIKDRRAAPKKPDDLLTHFVNNPQMDDGLIRDQILTLLIAGHDTSTASLTWAFYLLGRHPHVLAQAQAEVDAVFGREPPTADKLGRLVYLDQVFKETLRLYPPIHVGNRLAAKNMTVQGYPIRAGTRVMCSIYLTHRSPQYWDEPDRFIPQRFAKGQASARPALAYVPYGAGPRNCIGAAFAQVEAKVILARVLQRFNLTLVSKRVRPHMGATLEPRPGVLMLIHRRQAPH
jgi:cytochrome P450